MCQDLSRAGVHLVAQTPSSRGCFHLSSLGVLGPGGVYPVVCGRSGQCVSLGDGGLSQVIRVTHAVHHLASNVGMDEKSDFRKSV